jgi:hypothetical protein
MCTRCFWDEMRFVIACLTTLPMCLPLAQISLLKHGLRFINAPIRSDIIWLEVGRGPVVQPGSNETRSPHATEDTTSHNIQKQGISK